MEFGWNQNRMAAVEGEFLLLAGVWAGAALHLEPGDLREVTAVGVVSEVLATSAMAGEVLDADGVRASVRKELGMSWEGRRVGRGATEMLVEAMRGLAEPLSDEMLFGWERRLFGRDLGYRDEATDAGMEQFVAWFNGSGPGGERLLPTVTRAGIAHFSFASMRPFEDGNGRMARALAAKALGQGTGQAAAIELATAMEGRGEEYVAAMRAAGVAAGEKDITPWLEWFGGVAVEGLRRAIGRAESTIAKARLRERMKGRLNARQSRALAGLMSGEFAGDVLGAGEYASVTGASAATATRDLQGMVNLLAVVREGSGRWARYRLALGG